MACAATVLGKATSQTNFAKAAGTDDNGTDEDGIRRGLLAHGFIPEVMSSNIMLAARNWMITRLRQGQPVIICINRWEHWTTVIGLVGLRFIMFDPARYKYRIDSGVTVYDWATLSRRWFANKKVRGSHGAYYGIAVQRREE